MYTEQVLLTPSAVLTELCPFENCGLYCLSLQLWHPLRFFHKTWFKYKALSDCAQNKYQSSIHFLHGIMLVCIFQYANCVRSITLKTVKVFLSSQLVVKRDIAVTILIRCMRMCASVRICLGHKSLLWMDFKIIWQLLSLKSAIWNIFVG